MTFILFILSFFALCAFDWITFNFFLNQKNILQPNRTSIKCLKEHPLTLSRATLFFVVWYGFVFCVLASFSLAPFYIVVQRCYYPSHREDYASLRTEAESISAHCQKPIIVARHMRSTAAENVCWEVFSCAILRLEASNDATNLKTHNNL